MRVIFVGLAGLLGTLSAMGQSSQPVDNPLPFVAPAEQATQPAGEGPPPAPPAPTAATETPAAARPNDLGVKPVSEMTIDELISGAERLSSVKRFTEALNLMQILLARDPENSEGLLMRSQIAWDAGEPELARTGWLKVRLAQPNEFRANFGLGRMYARTRVWPQARTYLEVAATVAPADRAAETLTLLALAYRGTGRAEEARQALERALQADPGYFDALDTLVTLRTQLQDFDGALADGDRLVSLAEEKAREGRSSRASLEQLDRAYDGKLRVLKERQTSLYARNPDGSPSDKLLPGAGPVAAQTLNAIIDTLWRQSELASILRNFDMVALAEKMVEYQPDVTDHYLTLGLLQLRCYQYEGARDAFFRALGLDRNNPVAREQAQVALRKIIELDPTNEAAQSQLNALMSSEQSPAEGGAPDQQ